VNNLAPARVWSTIGSGYLSLFRFR
jgi:hypothetical protein